MSSKRFVFSNCSLSYKEWGASNSTKKVLALHGWLDNSNSFNFLGPYLADRGFHVVAYDNIGHGYSSHGTSSSNNYNVASYVGRCRDIIDSLEWERCNIVGHSLGASLTTIFAATYPETVENMALIENFVSPMIQPAERARNILRRAIDSERVHRLKQSNKTGPKSYDTLQDAIMARMSSVKRYPGKQFLSIEAAASLVARFHLKRSSSQLYNGRGVSLTKSQGAFGTDPQDAIEMTDISEGPVSFRHDSKLVLPSYFNYTKQQLESFVNVITAKTLLITAENGWPPEHGRDHDDLVDILKLKGLLTDLRLPGSHHLHLDPGYADVTAQHVAAHFMNVT